jgi:CarboxypepD_reg-like domain
VNAHALLLAGALAQAASAASAQIPVRGRVVAAENGQPLVGASVFALVSKRGSETDRHGRFVLWLHAVPDTLVARFIGRAADTLIVADTAPADVELRLDTAAVPLAGVVVYGDPGRPADAAAGAATWSLPREAVAAVPAAIEGDVFRGLALSPAVAYSTPISSQPFVRGTDAGAVGYRLDGFTVINPFHLGRIFSALMPQAVQSANLMAAPFDEEFGDATSAVIDAQLREGGDALRGGVQASFVSTAAWAGGPAGSHRWFAAWRHGFLEHLGGPFHDVPYRFNDVYGRFTLAAPWGPVEITGFWSNDGIHDRETGEGVGWSNALLGVRAPLALGRAGRLELWGEVSGFREDVVQFFIRGADTDVQNRFFTDAFGARLQWTGAHSAASFGAELRHRRMENRIEGGDQSAPSADVAGLVGAATAGFEHRAGRLAVRLGLRLDADRAVQAWQPRVRFGTDLGGGWSLGLAAGRTARLYHVIPEVLPGVEDILSVYDLWRPGGRDGIPLTVADNGLVEIKRTTPRFSVRASAFASRLQGVGEVRRSILESSDSAFFRFGRGHVWGVDAEIGWSGSRRSLALAYVLSWSRRAWDRPDAAEIPWRYDRRHQARAFASWFPGRGWRLNLLGDLSSSDPITPALATLEPGVLRPDGTLDRSPFYGEALVFGPENSARGGWTGHVDLGLQKEIGGPGSSTGRIGISILNLAFTPIAPAVPEVDFDKSVGFVRVRYRPRLFLPPVPTLTFMLEF